MKRRLAYALAVILACLCAVVVLATAPARAAPPNGNAVIDGSHAPELTAVTQRLLAYGAPPSSARLEAIRPTPPLGTVVRFWVWDFAYGSFHAVSATLQAIGPNVELYVENGYTVPSGVISDTIRQLETNIIPREHGAFGTEPRPGIDGNNRINVLLLDIRDGQYYGFGGPMVGGYFWYLNEYAQADIDRWFPDLRLKSNEREIIFVDLPATIPGSPLFYQTIAHELQHMIHWNYDADEDGWLNESLSNLAAHLSGFGLPSSHVRAFLADHNNSLTQAGGNVLADYGAYGLFGLYLWEQYGGDAFTRDLVAERTNGISSVDAILARRGYRDRFANVVSHWAVANFLDDPAIYGYRGIDIVPSSADGVTTFARPRPLTHAVPPTRPTTISIAPWAADYITFVGLERGDLVLTLTAGISANLMVNVITSTSDSFTTGTNALRELPLSAGTRASLRLVGAGAVYSSVLLIPVHLSDATAVGLFTYEASLIPAPLTDRPPENPPPTPTTTTTPSPTPVATATPSPSPSPTLTATATPGTPSPTPTASVPPPYTVRINCGGPAITDSQGRVWEADRPYVPGGAGYVEGQIATFSNSIAETEDDALYQTERWGLKQYAFHAPNGTYTVTLAFAENYFTQPNNRWFDVVIEGSPVLVNFDIIQAAGGPRRAVQRRFTADVQDGRLDVQFVTRRGQATIQAIAVEALGQ